MAATVTHRKAKAVFFYLRFYCYTVLLQEMAKGRMKTSSSESLTPPQPRSLRSRKREYPSDEDSLTGEVPAPIHQQDTEDNENEKATATPQQIPCSPHLESTGTSAQQDPAADQQQPDDAKEEKHAKGTSLNLEDEAGNAFEGQQEMTTPNPERDSQLESFRVCPEEKEKNPVVFLRRCGSGKRCKCCSKQASLSADIQIQAGNDHHKEEITAEECRKSIPQTCTTELHDFLPTSEGVNESGALEEQIDARENSHCDLERNQQETSRDETSRNVEITKEAVVGFPAKKKRRMGMCGLTERERNHFLQAQNGQNGLERVERQVCTIKADPSAKEGVVSFPSLPSSPPLILESSVTELREAEIKPQCLHCEGVNRAETEVHVAVSVSNGTRTVCDPGCSEGESDEADGGSLPGPEQTGDSNPGPSAEEEEACLGNPEQREQEGGTAEIRAETQQMESEENCAAEVETCCTKPSQTEKQEEEREAAPLQVQSVTVTRDETKEEITGDAETKASSTDAQREGFSASVELCDAAATPGGSDRNSSCGPDVKPASSPAMNEDSQSRETTDPFGSGGLDYVSDSQLNTIVWIEEETVDKDGAVSSSDSNEDATDLICGLIRELASLNRTVMVTHRELENLRRSGRSSRSSTR